MFLVFRISACVCKQKYVHIDRPNLQRTVYNVCKYVTFNENRDEVEQATRRTTTKP